MGYMNQTCAAGRPAAGTASGAAATYGPTVRPVLRSAVLERWEQWRVTVVGRSPEGDDLVTLKTSYPYGRGGAPL